MAGDTVMFIDREYTRDEIYDLVGGGSKQSYLPTLKGVVLAACLRKDHNPDAPEVILCGQGPIIVASGTALATQRNPIPVFVKIATKRWKFHGCFTVKASYTSGPRFNKFVRDSGRRDVSRVIELIASAAI